MPKKDKNDQEGPDIRSSLIKVNIDGDTVFVDSNQYKPQVRIMLRNDFEQEKGNAQKS